MFIRLISKGEENRVWPCWEEINDTSLMERIQRPVDGGDVEAGEASDSAIENLLRAAMPLQV